VVALNWDCCKYRLVHVSTTDVRETHELNVRELKDLAQHGAGEEGSMLDGNIARVLASILIRHPDFPQESVGRLTHDHGGEELTAEPSTATRGDIGLDDGNLQVRTGLGSYQHRR
jgi:hypothetical protein